MRAPLERHEELVSKVTRSQKRLCLSLGANKIPKTKLPGNRDPEKEERKSSQGKKNTPLWEDGFDKHGAA